MARASKIAFVFVCQGGPLEAKALLLAASVARHATGPKELVAAVPENGGRPVPPATIDTLRSLGVRVVPIRNELSADYPIGNKVSALRVPVDADRLVFIDTDVMLTRELGHDPRLTTAPFAAKPADLPNVISRWQWRRAYGAAKLRPPQAWVTTTMYGQIALPYFNAGLISVDPRAGFGDAWLDCCKRIDATWGILLKRPHLDQIALPVALRKLDLAYDCLDERYNYPAHLKPVDPRTPPLFVHYHSPEVLRREPRLSDLVRDLCDEHPTLGDRLRADESYAPLFGPHVARSRPTAAMTAGSVPAAGHPPRNRTPELIITGVPRSGTSFLCNLLHRFENCVVLNEPDAVARPLRKEPIPYAVATFYRDVRRQVLEGRPIRNKLRDGKVTDETMDANDLAEYVPTVANAEFVLGAKSPLGFLSRLHGLRRAMPEARVVACVRNPFDTIASWKTTFSHLRDASVAKQALGGLRDPLLSPRQRAALKDVAKMTDPAWRRAAWWRYLADLILDAGPEVIVVPYPQLASDPMAVVGRILDGFDAGGLREPIVPSTARAAKRSALDAEDVRAIRSLCGEAAAALGVTDGWASDDLAPSRSAARPVAPATFDAKPQPALATAG